MFVLFNIAPVRLRVEVKTLTRKTLPARPLPSVLVILALSPFSAPGCIG
ncbi:hypothetical protein KCP78_16505 [Salmonella enterica subsp. enterica]|nr:hypothetical protein KCP78_16505 [Salmonella enterica subsp. enterica]